jgi:hypothetical protein
MFSSNASSVSGDANFVEDVFSTFLYTGNGTSQTITNGVDLAGEGGLVWVKSRTNTSGGATSHALVDSARGIANWIATDATGGNANFPNLVTAFNASGFSVGNAPYWANENNIPYSSWTFRDQAKFFDAITWTGNGSSYRTLSHALSSTPGVVIAKRTDSSGDWFVWHTSLGKDAGNSNGVYNTMNLNTTDAVFSTVVWGDTRPSVIPDFTSTQFSVGGNLNLNGATYVAHIYAHNAGGFGLTGTDNVISCGSFTTDGSGNATVNLGYEPQWVMIKSTNLDAPWWMLDTMRGWNQSNDDRFLRANSSVAEAGGQFGTPTATGFTAQTQFGALNTFIYIAIRRGPMKVPTTGTSVFAVTTFTGVDTAQTAGFPVDFVAGSANLSGTIESLWIDRLRGNTKKLETPFTNAEGTVSDGLWDSNTQVRLTSSGNSFKRLYPMFRRAPGFFDEVCYTGNGTQALTHNLGVVPEMFILKNRAGGTDGNWIVYHAAVGNTAALQLNLTAAPAASSVYFANTSPTSTVFTVGTNQSSSGGTYVAYLFASAPGVSKVGSYTGNGSNQTINCGFTGGARFVMIKRTDDNGDWYVWDTARGIVSGNDPHLSLNTTAAEVTTDDTIDTDSTGFVVNQVSATNVNVSSATYIFLAIA